MKSFVLVFLLSLLALDCVCAQVEPDPLVPPWTEDDLKALEEGSLVPGFDLLLVPLDPSQEALKNLLSPEVELPEREVKIELVPEPEVDPTLISDADLIRYFSKQPKSYLVDLQGLLSEPERDDSEAFLVYHRQHSQIPITLFLFESEQEVPEDFAPEIQLRKQFDSNEGRVLVYYFLGDPERTQLVMSPELRVLISGLEADRFLGAGIAGALGKSDAVDQLSNFVVELSIEMYLIERKYKEETQRLEQQVMESEAAVPTPLSKADELWVIWQRVKKPVLIGAFVLLVGFLGWVVRWLAFKRRCYVFPAVDAPSRLGAPHAAGVGAVISFRSSQLPPSRQKEQAPDYLQRY